MPRVVEKGDAKGIEIAVDDGVGGEEWRFDFEEFPLFEKEPQSPQ